MALFMQNHQLMTIVQEEILLAELNRARAREAWATEEYWTVLSKLTHIEPSSDDLNKLCSAGRSKTAARQALWDALSKLDDFRASRMALSALQAA